MTVPGQHPSITKLQDNIATQQFGITPAQAIAQGLCISCKKHAIPRCSTEAGRREYRISGMCEMCFDELFAEEEQ